MNCTLLGHSVTRATLLPVCRRFSLPRRGFRGALPQTAHHLLIAALGVLRMPNRARKRREGVHHEKVGQLWVIDPRRDQTMITTTTPTTTTTTTTTTAVPNSNNNNCNSNHKNNYNEKKKARSHSTHGPPRRVFHQAAALLFRR